MFDPCFGLFKYSARYICTVVLYKYTEKFVILQSIGIIAVKVEEQGQLSTPADILVDSLIPNSVH